MRDHNKRDTIDLVHCSMKEINYSLPVHKRIIQQGDANNPDGRTDDRMSSIHHKTTVTSYDPLRPTCIKVKNCIIYSIYSIPLTWFRIIISLL